MFVPNKILIERLKQCNVCDHNKAGICAKCGCIIRLKTQLKSSKCPIDKWGEFSEKDQNQNQ